MKLSDVKKQNKKEAAERLKQKVNIFLARYFKWIIIFIVFIIFLAGYMFLKPKYQTVVQLVESKSRQEEQDYLEQKKRFKELDDLINIYKEIDPADIRKVNLILSKDNTPEELFSELESLILKNGLLLVSLRLEPEDLENKQSTLKSRAKQKEKEPEDNLLPQEIGKIQITLDIIGADYFGLKNIVSAIENNLRLMDITDLDFSPHDSSVTLKIDTYYLKQEI